MPSSWDTYFKELQYGKSIIYYRLSMTDSEVTSYYYSSDLPKLNFTVMMLWNLPRLIKHIFLNLISQNNTP